MSLVLNLALKSSANLTCMLSLACRINAMSKPDNKLLLISAAFMHMLTARLPALTVAASLRQQQGHGRVACKVVVQ